MAGDVGGAKRQRPHGSVRVRDVRGGRRSGSLDIGHWNWIVIGGNERGNVVVEYEDRDTILGSGCRRLVARSGSCNLDSVLEPAKLLVFGRYT